MPRVRAVVFPGALAASVLAAPFACAPLAPPAASVATPVASSPTRVDAGAVDAPHAPVAAGPWPAFAAYHPLLKDAFDGPSGWDPSSPSSTWPSSGSKLWSWGFSGAPDGTPLHYLVLHGNPDDDPTSLAILARAPEPTLPAGARLLYAGHDWSEHEWVFESVVVTGAPFLTGADVASCALADNDDHTMTNGQDVVKPRPWIKIRFTESGEQKLASLPANTPLVVTLGGTALAETWWFPNWTATTWSASDFLVAGRTDPERRAQAASLLARCEAARAGTAP